MKSATLCLTIATVSFFGLSAFAQGTRSTAGGNQPGTCPTTGAPVFPNLAPQSAPRARITVLSSTPQGDFGATPAVPAARITPVTENSRDEATSAAPETVHTDEVSPVLPEFSPATDKTVEAATEVPEEVSAIAEALKGLVGTWLAVARHGDGELTTVELKLDDRGWAQLTVPGADGKPTTIERRVEFENEELKLAGPDSVMTLGKLVDVNSRQMVLERAEGQVTFVRN